MMIKTRNAAELAQIARTGAALVIDGASYSAPHLKYIAEAAAGASGSVTMVNMSGHGAPEIGSIASAGPTLELDAGKLTPGELASIARLSAQGRGALVVNNSDKLRTAEIISIYENNPRKIAFR